MINELLLFFSLFMPRISLFAAYITGAIPPNSVPFAGDVILTALFPRALMLFYIYENLGMMNFWFFAHVIAWVISWAFIRNTGIVKKVVHHYHHAR